MRKILLIFSCVTMCMISTQGGALTINKSAPVAPVESSTSTATASLVPTVLGIISNVRELNAKQKQLTDECIPTDQEINWVNNMVKEWAKTGTMTAEDVESRLSSNVGIRRCTTSSGSGYANSVRVAAQTEMEDFICYDYFDGSGNDDMVWEGFPKAAKTSYCSDGSTSCGSSDRVTVSNIYDIFNLIDFSVEDFYGSSEVTMFGKLTDKIEKCSNSRLSARKRQMWGEFLTNTINSLGEPTNTGSIMETVTSITGSGSGIGTIGSLALQFFGNQ